MYCVLLYTLLPKPHLHLPKFTTKAFVCAFKTACRTYGLNTTKNKEGHKRLIALLVGRVMVL